MSIIIEATPGHPKLFEEGSEAVSTPEMDLAWKLQSAYYQRFAFYERELAGVLDLLEKEALRLAPSYFPKVSVVFDGEEEEVVFDFSLYESLLEIYIFEGWEGILQVEQVLDKRLPQPDEDAPSAGTPVNARTLWLPVKTFFCFTRNLLALLIRDTLAEIERKAAAVITAGLSRSAILVAKAWVGEFQFKRKEIVMELAAEDPYNPPNKPKYYKYSCKNRGLSDTLFKSLSEAVQQKHVYEQLLKKISDIQWKVESNARARFYDYATPYNETEENLAREVQLAEQSKTFLESMKAVIYLNCPVGLIVLDGLKIGFTQAGMEQKLGMALWEIYGKIDEIGRGVDSRVSRVAAEWSTPVAEENISFSYLEAIRGWKPPEKGFERFIVETAVKRLADDPGWFPLAHEETWHRLIESGVIAKDSFEYIVYSHYVSVLIDSVDAKREAKEAFDKFWKTFSRGAAALSLATLASPVTAEFAPVLRGMSVAADLVVLAYTIHSVYGNLAQLDQLLAKELVHPDAFALEHLARVGELAQIRRDAVDQIEQQILIDLATVTGARWASVKKLTLARGYYFDLETLLDDGEEDES